MPSKIALTVVVCALIGVIADNESLRRENRAQGERHQVIATIANRADMELSTCISYQARVQIELEQLNRRCR